MSQYFKILLAAAIAVFVAYAGFMSLILIGVSSAKALTLGVLGYVAWVAIVIAVQAAMTPGLAPDEREALIDLRSEQLAARMFEAGIFALLALVLVSAFTGPEVLGCFAPNRPEALVAYLISIVTAATLARLTYALWQERRV